MKKLFFSVMMMGVLLLQSCVSYRIKVVEHKSGVQYYFPQKRILLGEWVDLTYGKSCGFTYKSARDIIKEDRKDKKSKISYINGKKIN
jgi:hypothetical protein